MFHVFNSIYGILKSFTKIKQISLYDENFATITVEGADGEFEVCIRRKEEKKDA